MHALAVLCRVSQAHAEDGVVDGSAAAAPAVAALPGPSLTSLTSEALAVMHQDGSVDADALTEMLQGINRQVAAHLVLDRHASCEGTLAGTQAPLEGSGWRLWVFWAVDVPECDGLASALVQLRALHVVAIRPVHLCGLTHWEAWMSHMNAQREELLRAAHAQDQSRCQQLAQTWREQLREFVAECAAFYHGSVPVMGSGRIALALHVDHVPCFRLISPDNQVHALDGFCAGFPLAGWIEHCQAWQAQQLQRASPGNTQR